MISSPERRGKKKDERTREKKALRPLLRPVEKKKKEGAPQTA